jgi:ribosomal protein S18 acetylase RimI-like enzyme
MVLFGCLGDRVVGVAVCFWGFSTFGGAPTVNLHDFSVLPEVQGKGVGTALLVELERRARQRGCCKMTLEVHDSNQAAKRLYARFGFEGWKPGTFFVAKPL